MRARATTTTPSAATWLVADKARGGDPARPPAAHRENQFRDIAGTPRTQKEINGAAQGSRRFCRRGLASGSGKRTRVHGGTSSWCWCWSDPSLVARTRKPRVECEDLPLLAPPNGATSFGAERALTMRNILRSRTCVAGASFALIAGMTGASKRSRQASQVHCMRHPQYLTVRPRHAHRSPGSFYVTTGARWVDLPVERSGQSGGRHEAGRPVRRSTTPSGTQRDGGSRDRNDLTNSAFARQHLADIGTSR